MVGTSQWETCYTRHFGMLKMLNCRSPLGVNRYSGQGGETMVTSLLKDCKDHACTLSFSLSLTAALSKRRAQNRVFLPSS